MGLGGIGTTDAEGEMEMDATECPSCKSDETYSVQDWLGKDYRECETCGCLYMVVYDIKVREITISKKRVMRGRA